MLTCAPPAQPRSTHDPQPASLLIRPCRSLTNPATDRVKQQQYQVDLGSGGGTGGSTAGGGSLRCAFSGTQDLIFLLLQREVGGRFWLVPCVLHP